MYDRFLNGDPEYNGRFFTGVTSGLQSLLHSEERPDIETTRRLMAVFSPFRSLATAHLWQFNRPEP